jgi:hypothetical protein
MIVEAAEAGEISYAHAICGLIMLSGQAAGTSALQ